MIIYKCTKDEAFWLARANNIYQLYQIKIYKIIKNNILTNDNKYDNINSVEGK